jgi:DHA1 family bicyclomycin/chloramphenicol resistance-like MFS transporter
VLLPALVMTGLFLFFGMSSHYIQTTLGYSQVFYSIIFAINACIYSLSSFLAPKFVSWFGGAKQLIHYSLVTIICATAFLMIQSILGYNNLFLFLAGIFTCCFCYGMIQGPSMGLTLEGFETNLGLASALMGTIQFSVASFFGMIAVHPPIDNSLCFALPMFFLSLMSYKVAFLQKRRMDEIKTMGFA